MKSIELFAGVGGLAIGLARAGFHHEVVIERNKDRLIRIEYLIKRDKKDAAKVTSLKDERTLREARVLVNESDLKAMEV